MPILGPLVIDNNPATGQLQSISLLGLPIGLHVDYEDAPGNSVPPPVQLGGITGDLDIIPLPQGPDIETIALTGPISLEAVFADNAGGATDSFLNLGNIEHATLLEGFSNRGFESLTANALNLQSAEVQWGGDGQGPTSSIGTDVPLENVFASLLHGPGGGTLTSVTTGGLIDSEFLFGDNVDQGGIGFPITTDDPLNGSLLAHLNDRGLESAAIHDVLGLGNPLDGGLLDGGLLNGGLLSSLGDLGLFDHS